MDLRIDFNIVATIRTITRSNRESRSRERQKKKLMSQPAFVMSSLGPSPEIDGPINAVHENEWYRQDFGDYVISELPIFTKRHIRVICVGAGATGLQLAYKAERLLENVSLQIYEKNSDVGGTWLENRQFTWARNPCWTHYYSPSAEIWRYFKDIATKFNLEQYVKLSHRVQSAKWNEDEGVWELTVLTPDGAIIMDKCEILVNGTGVLNNWKYPNIPGLSSFKGKLMHSSNWDAEYDLSGKTVAVIGGGSSAVQVIPSIQPDTNEQIESFKEDPVQYDKYCREVEGELNKRFTLNHLRSKDQQISRELVEGIMQNQLGHDERLVSHLIPEFALGCRRMTPGSGYLQSLTKDNVEVVTSGAVRLTEAGIIDETGKEHRADVVICSTGFDTSFAPPYECIGRGGQSLRKKFGDFPKGYFSIMVDDFPNLFLFIGPNGPASHSSLLPVLEWHTRYLFNMINKLQSENIKAFDPKPECIEEFSQHTHTLMKRLVWSAACRSWFKNGKAHGPVTAIWPGSRLHYFKALKDPRYEDYRITYRSKNRYQYLGNGYTKEEMDLAESTSHAATASPKARIVLM
ncbi:hypothetical protein G7046_g6330 [Stylonectria norvegica]|nr:hypothetical protein G7046_g6330 [Stylonectria norvegica]